MLKAEKADAEERSKGFASSPNKYAKSCHGKVKYLSLGLANAVAEDRTKVTEKPHSAYICRYCKWWHVGATPKRGRR